jgi:hypothetical protein
VISKKDVDRSAASGANYQDEIITHAEDDLEVFHDGDDDDDETVLEAVSKVRTMLLLPRCVQQIAWLTTTLLSASQNCARCSLKSTEAAKLA